MIKTVGVQLALFLGDPQIRRNVRALVKFLLLLVGIIVANSILFRLIMLRVEGIEHSWVTSLYWTLVTMTTVGFGDITFESDIGRLFSIVVLFTGVFFLLIVLPFVFIRHFYAPWLEAQLRLRAPRDAETDLKGHVVFCDYDVVAEGVVEGLKLLGIPYLILDPNPERASRRYLDGLPVISGELDEAKTYERARIRHAKLVVANLDDVTNTNIILTVREVSASIPIAAFCSTEDAIDLLGLAGANHVLPLRKRLGEHLANRINAGRARLHTLGTIRNLIVAEFPARHTPLVGKRIRDTPLREHLGINIIAIWKDGVLHPARADDLITEDCLPVVVGTGEQLEELDEFLCIYDTNWNPAIVIGGGKVGRSVTRALQAQGVAVHMIERKPELAARWATLPDRLFVGDAAHRELLDDAGIMNAPAVVLTTNDDAMNVYLAVYCRRLNPDLQIVSRVTHDRNVDSIQRAGADLVLSYAALGREAILSLARDRTLVFLGEGVELFEEGLPEALEGKTLAESGLGARLGLNVVAIETEEGTTPAPRATEVLSKGTRLYMIGTSIQHDAFQEEFSPRGRR